jgi:hypothetical protein
MGLFHMIPENLFSLLASKNKEIYLDGLFVLRRAYKQEMIITKDQVVAMLISELEDRMMEIDLEDEEGEDEQGITPERNLSALAHFLIRKFNRTGWIDVEYATDSFEEQITLYDYSVKILNTLHELLDTTPREYNSFVYSTYSLLKTANEERDMYTYNALTQAYKNTSLLVDELKSLLNNIRRYHQALLDQTEVRGILKEHFDSFKEMVEDKIYHPLKTFDSVPRFKTPIINILKNWLDDPQITDILVTSAQRRKQGENKEDIIEEIIIMIEEIIGTYERLDILLKEIDRKKAAYTRASIEKVEYLLNTDRSIKGKLVEILKSAGKKGKQSEKLQQVMQESQNLFPQAFLDEFSLYVRRKKRIREPGEPLKMAQTVDNALLEKELDDLVDRVKNSYTTRRIMNFMEQQFAGRQVIETGDLQISGDEDFIMIILGALKHDEAAAFYQIEFLPGYLLLDGYRLPQMRLSRKEHSHVVG